MPRGAREHEPSRPAQVLHAAGDAGVRGIEAQPVAALDRRGDRLKRGRQGRQVGAGRDRPAGDPPASGGSGPRRARAAAPAARGRRPRPRPWSYHPAPVAAPRTLTRKILERRLRDGRLEPGAEIVLAVDQVLIEDATGTMAGMQFEELGVDRVAGAARGRLRRPQRPPARPPQHGRRTATCRRSARATASRTRRPGNGISHYVHLERFARPGQLLVGADSHTSTAGRGSACSRSARAGSRSRSRWPATPFDARLPDGRGRRADAARSARLGAGEGRHPRAAAPPRRARRRRAGVRVPRRRRRDACRRPSGARSPT